MAESKVYMTHNEFVLFCMWYYKRNNLKISFEFHYLMSSELIFIIGKTWYFGHSSTNMVTLWMLTLKSLNELHNKFLEEEDIV